MDRFLSVSVEEALGPAASKAMTQIRLMKLLKRALKGVDEAPGRRAGAGGTPFALSLCLNPSVRLGPGCVRRLAGW